MFHLVQKYVHGCQIAQNKTSQPVRKRLLSLKTHLTFHHREATKRQLRTVSNMFADEGTLVALYTKDDVLQERSPKLHNIEEYGTP